MLIRRHRQILALASPVRLALIDALEGVGPCSVAALAQIVGARPDGLYYHLRILEKQGLIRHVAGSTLRPQAILDVTRRPLFLAYDAKDTANRQAVTRVVAAMLRAAHRAFRATFRVPRRVSGKRRELWAAQRTARLTPEQLEHVNRQLNELLDTFEQTSAQSSGRLYQMTFVLSPHAKNE